MQARIAAERGEKEAVSRLVERALGVLPGFDEMVYIALDAGIELPPRAEELAKDRGLRKRWREKRDEVR